MTQYTIARSTSIIGSLFFAAIFGFFYGWSVSTLWGLDTLDPNTAIEAMNAMNISVRNMAFMPAFFGTIPIGIIVAVILFATQHRRAAIWFGLATAVYIGRAFIPTTTVNMPMNEALKLVQVPMDMSQAQEIWAPYSADWKFYNWVRTGFAGIAFILTALGISSIVPTRLAQNTQ